MLPAGRGTICQKNIINKKIINQLAFMSLYKFLQKWDKTAMGLPKHHFLLAYQHMRHLKVFPRKNHA